MARDQLLRVRLCEEEFNWLKDYAEFKNRQISEVIRDYIKRLPRQTDGD